MKTNKFKLAFTAMLTLVCANVFAEDTPNIRIAGHYLDATNLKAPLILDSKDYGASWAFDRNLQGINTSATLNDVACKSSSCNAVGSIDEAGHTRPLIMHHSYESPDWEINELKNLPQFDDARFDRVDCFISVCFARGVKVVNGKSQALLYIGDVLDDRSNAWRPAQLDDNVQTVEALARGDRYVGFFKETGSNNGSFVYSKDDGFTWSKGVVDNAADAHIAIADLKCNGNYCVAVGKTATHDDWSAALFHSSDAGKHWRIIPDVVEKSATLQTITYAQGWGWSHWVAAGTHEINGGKKVPLSIRSDEYDGEEWSIAQSNFKLADGWQVSEISSSSCSSLECVAAGRMGSANQPAKVFVMTSNDAGTSWQQSTDVPETSVPMPNSVKLYCTYSRCTLVMTKDTAYPHAELDYPEILNSQDRGAHWSYINNVVNMPKSKEVQLTGVSGSKSK